MNRKKIRRKISGAREGNVSIGVVLLILLIVGMILLGAGVVTIPNLIDQPEEQTVESTYTIGDTPQENPSIGWLWYDTISSQLKTWNGYNWQQIAPIVGRGYDYHAAKHEWGGIDPIEVSKLSPQVRIASEFAESGSGTFSDPWINGIQEAYDNIHDSLSGETWGHAVIFLPPGFFWITTDIVFDSSIIKNLVIRGMETDNPCVIATEDIETLFTLYPTNRGSAVHMSHFGMKGNGNNGIINKGVKRFISSYMEYEGFKEVFRQSVTHGVVYGIDWVKFNNARMIASGTSSTAPYYFENTGIEGTQLGLLSIIASRIKGGYDDAGGHGTAIEIEDDAVDRWIISNCQFEDSRTVLDIKGKIGAGGIGGINPYFPLYTGDGSYCIRLRDLTTPHNAHILISGIREKPGAPRPPDYGIYIGNNWDYVDVKDNSFTDCAIEAIHVNASANVHGIIKNNIGANPFGVITNPFNNTNHLVHMSGDVSSPVASQDYSICMTSCRIISTDSGDTNCSIIIKDKDGNIIESGLSTYDNWLEPGWTINWGAFTGTAPTVTVIFT